MPVSRATYAPPELDRLRPYTFHGVALTARGGQAVGDCPFCMREEKFSVEVATGLWQCWRCGAAGNPLGFIRQLYEAATAAALGPPAGLTGLPPSGAALDAAPGRLCDPGAFLAAVARDRRLLGAGTPAAWGVAPAADGAWLVPGYSVEGRLDQVYRRVRMQDRGEWVHRLLPTPGVWPEGRAHALHLPVGDFDPARPNVDVLEGPWDGMAYWEVARSSNTNVVAVPGCNVWRDEWTALCRGKNVTLWYDSDYPREYTPGRTSQAGRDGMARVVRRLAGVATLVRCVKWGPEWYDPTKPGGWDVRDHLSAGEDRVAALAELLSKVELAPAEWSGVPAVVNGYVRGAGVEAASCSTWAACEAAWDLRRGGAMFWRQDLADTLAVILAVCASTPQAGNQLFLDLIGSPGSAKTTLCQGLLVSQNCIHVENVSKLLSGFKKPGEKDTDCSFLARANGKTWVTCEFDVLASSPHYRDIMGKVRRIFDGETTATYGNDDKDHIYTALRTPWIRAGTQRMMDRMADYDQSQLGDRFLRLIIGDPSDADRRSIARSALRSERVAVLDCVNGIAGSTVDTKTRLAHALTGGYVDWLRAYTEERLARVEVPESVEDYCIDLAELSADMRARPCEDRRKVDVHSTKELPTRLARQNIRLAMCLAVVLNKTSVDVSVLRIVRKVALDTACGHSLNIAQWLCSPNPKAGGRTYQESGGLADGTLSVWTGMPPERLNNYLSFLRSIGVLELMVSHGRSAWVLTRRALDLYLRVMEGQHG